MDLRFRGPAFAGVTASPPSALFFPRASEFALHRNIWHTRAQTQLPVYLCQNAQPIDLSGVLATQGDLRPPLIPTTKSTVMLVIWGRARGLCRALRRDHGCAETIPGENL